jgi:NADH:ubiquinone reductase (H+-translocating)
MYLIGFKNRLTTMLHWAVSFIFRGRSQRTTTRQQIVARTLMARLSATEEAMKQAQETAKSIEPAAGATTGAAEAGPGDGRTETVGTDSVDELRAAYGDANAEAGEAVRMKPAPES